MNLISSFRLTEAFLQDNISRINSRIFIGDIDALNDESIIKENKITHVVTTVEKTEYIKFLRVTYCEPIEYIEDSTDNVHKLADFICDAVRFMHLNATGKIENTCRLLRRDLAFRDNNSCLLCDDVAGEPRCSSTVHDIGLENSK